MCQKIYTLLDITLAIRAVAEKITGAVISPAGIAASPSLTASDLGSGPRSSNLRVRKSFTDRDKDKFLEDAFEFIAKFFEGSLDEIAKRNPGIEGNFRRVDANRFIAVIYEGGQASSRCRISCGGRRSFMSGITYSMSDSLDESSYNEQLSVEDDGYTLNLRPLGMMMQSKELLSVEGAAEFYWGMFVKPLQN